MPQTSLSDRIDTFIAAATTKHDGTYDYSRVAERFVNAHTKVTIGCPDHGDFDQTPHEHRRGQRCPDCSKRRGSRPAVRQKHFIERARAIHGDRYDYSDVAFLDQHTPVVIICRDHGPFPQRPMNHLSSHTPSNCLGCAASTRRASLKAAWKERAAPTRGTTDNV